jgi:hypothetical protein
MCVPHNATPTRKATNMTCGEVVKKKEREKKVMKTKQSSLCECWRRQVQSLGLVWLAGGQFVKPRSSLTNCIFMNTRMYAKMSTTHVFTIPHLRRSLRQTELVGQAAGAEVRRCLRKEAMRRVVLKGGWWVQRWDQ